VIKNVIKYSTLQKVSTVLKMKTNTVALQNNFILKVKVKLSLCLSQHHAMKTYWGVELQLHAFLTSALGGGEWSDSRPGRFTPRERAPSSHWIGGWMGPRTVLGTVVKRSIPSPRLESKPRTPTVQPIAQRYTDRAITALNTYINL
jgi:hypothetical protein